MIKRSINFIACIASLFICSRVYSQAWYEKEKAIVDDPYAFNLTFNGAGTLFKSGLSLGGDINTGYYYAIFSNKEIKDIWSKTGHGILMDEVKIDKDDVAQYRDFFRKKGKDISIPTLASASLEAALSGYVKLGLVAMSTILGVVDNLSESNRSNAIALSEVIATDGVFSRELVLENMSSTMYYANMFSIYRVKVGGEDRRYILSKLRVAIKIE